MRKNNIGVDNLQNYICAFDKYLEHCKCGMYAKSMFVWTATFATPKFWHVVSRQKSVSNKLAPTSVATFVTS
jgi:hypothetical protein